MLTVPLPSNEEQRLKALHRYQVLDTPPEANFDRITNLAARLFDVPITLVSLVDEFRTWFKSCYGFDTHEVDRESSICSLAILDNNVLVIPDTREDARCAGMPLTRTEPGLRFYAGAPLITQDGFILGTLCLLDSKPRQEFNSEQIATLKDLAAIVIDELELHLAAQKIARMDAALLEITQGVSATTGEAFLFSLVKHLTQVLGVDCAFIGELAGENRQHVKTLAIYDQKNQLENIEYSLVATPCQQVIQQKKTCCYPYNLQAAFPTNPLLAQMKINSYIATPLVDSTGSVIGLLGVMDRKHLENIQIAESLLAIFSTRAVAELERQRTEEERTQLLAREQAARTQAEIANRVKDEFMAVLSHELRSPLNPILGWAKLLQTRNLSEEMTRRAIGIIERNALQQAQLIEDLLDISRIMRGKTRINFCPVNLILPIEAAIETMRLAAEAKSIQLKSVIELPGAMVSGDSSRLQQIIWNLLSNAIKFTPTGGTVEIRLAAIASEAQIQVKDSGRGISAEFLPHVFEYFRQADASTTRTQGGLGLGLAIVRHLVELHGGTVEVDSPGIAQGAIFTVKLPLLKQQEPQLKLAAEDDFLNLQGVRLLVVDDEPDAREFLSFALEEYGAKVTAVSSVAEALAVIEKLKPDALLSDVGMPTEDGYTLIRKVRELERHQGGCIPAIAITAYAREEDRLCAMEAGFQMHIAKPIEPAKLVAAVASLTNPIRV
jgi:signal transduction histidine kinase/ActR/RegA family two-component response regulator